MSREKMTLKERYEFELHHAASMRDRITAYNQKRRKIARYLKGQLTRASNLWAQGQKIASHETLEAAINRALPLIEWDQS